jgi:hypothetical protein
MPIGRRPQDAHGAEAVLLKQPLGSRMTEQQVTRIVEHLCEQLPLAIRLKGIKARPLNADDLGFDSATVRTVLLTSLHLAGVTIHDVASDNSEEPPWS